MKVAILTRDYPPAIGGVATHVEGLVKALRRLGVGADLYVGSNDVKTLLLPFDMPMRDYDLVHVQSLPYGAFVFGAPLVVTVHSPVLEEFAHYRKALKAVSIPAVAMEKASLSRARAVLAVSAQSRSDLVSKYGLEAERDEVIGNGVDYARLSARREAAHSSMKRVLNLVSCPRLGHSRWRRSEVSILSRSLRWPHHRWSSSSILDSTNTTSPNARRKPSASSAR
jgi:glycosyltransferase involved in cell wall biosynthesis